MGILWLPTMKVSLSIIWYSVLECCTKNILSLLFTSTSGFLVFLFSLTQAFICAMCCSFGTCNRKVLRHLNFCLILYNCLIRGMFPQWTKNTWFHKAAVAHPTWKLDSQPSISHKVLSYHLASLGCCKCLFPVIGQYIKRVWNNQRLWMPNKSPTWVSVKKIHLD